MDKHNKHSDGENYSFVMMNLDSIFDHLKMDLFEFLPSRFIVALNGLKKEKGLRRKKDCCYG